MKKKFIEIGTCDFDTCVPLLRNGWEGVFVEPVKEYLENVKTEAGNLSSNATFINKAVSSKDGWVNFAISQKTNDWVRGISHIVGTEFYHEKLLEQPQNKQFLNKITSVPSITLDSIISECNFNTVDYLKIDAQGHDLIILENYSWSVKPTFIRVEHIHLDDTVLAKLLEDQGYIVYVEHRDIFAVI